MSIKKKLLTDWEWLSIRILILGLTVFCWSYITEIEGVTEIFGDVLYKKYSYDTDLTCEWGFRHYVYTVTFALLTCVQIVRITKWADIRSKASDGFEIKCKD